MLPKELATPAKPPRIEGIKGLTLRKLTLVSNLGPNVTPKQIQLALGCSLRTAYDYYNALRFIRARQVRTVF